MAHNEKFHGSNLSILNLEYSRVLLNMERTNQRHRTLCGFSFYKGNRGFSFYAIFSDKFFISGFLYHVHNCMS